MIILSLVLVAMAAFIWDSDRKTYLNIPSKSLFCAEEKGVPQLLQLSCQLIDLNKQCDTVWKLSGMPKKIIAQSMGEILLKIKKN